MDNDSDDQTPAETKQRIQETLEFLEQSSNWFDQIKRMERSSLIKVMNLGSKIQSFLGISKK